MYQESIQINVQSLDILKIYSQELVLNEEKLYAQRYLL